MTSWAERGNQCSESVGLFGVVELRGVEPLTLSLIHI